MGGQSPALRRSIPRTALSIICSAYFLYALFFPDWQPIIDSFNLAIHEAGHLLFSPFGRFMHIAGGSIFQVLVPAIFAIYFYRRGDKYAFFIILFLVGESLINVSIYAADAVRMELPLLGGDPAGHDWHNMLESLGLLNQTPLVAGLLRTTAGIIIVGAATGSFFNAERNCEAASF